MAPVSPRERELINAWQRGFPLEPRPFRRIAAAFWESETEVMARVRSLIKRDIVSRVGAVVTPTTAGASTLAAMAVPPDRLDEVAAVVDAEPAVNHNYEREHAVNLWFVVAASDAEEVRATLDRIAKATGLSVIDLPLEKAYHIDLGFPI